MRQSDLFAAAGRPAPPLGLTPDPEVIRGRLRALLATARAAVVMPWDGRAARVNALVFHNSANWLPEPERDALRRAFAAELERLGGVPPAG